jgi:hypothetical protein
MLFWFFRTGLKQMPTMLENRQSIASQMKRRYTTGGRRG